MKKLALYLLIFLFILAGIYAFLQSDFTREYIKKKLSSSLVDLGIDIQIEKLEGTLPNTLKMQGLTFKKDNTHFTVQTLTLKPILWRLFKGEIAFKNIEAKQILIDRLSPFDFEKKETIFKKRALLQGN